MNQNSEETWKQHLHSETRSAQSLGRPVTELRVPGLTILGHPDARRVGERATLPELSSGKSILLSRLEPLFAAPGETVRRPLADPFVSRRPAKLSPTREAGVHLYLKLERPALSADGVAVEGERTLSAEDIERGVLLVLEQRVVLLLHLLSPSPPRGVRRFGMVGESPAFVQMCHEISQVASLGAPVLLRGETGSGKELVASAIHQASCRRVGPYVAVNVGAIPAPLAAAELFGAVRGAFTGADRRRTGYFVRADGGTLLLDEVGETPPEVQVLLLRVLEEGEIHAVGSGKANRVDVRVVAATDADLEAKIESGAFRAPLLHRLSAHEIRLPSLRERRDDIGRLLIHFLRQEMAAVDGATSRLDSDMEAVPWLPASLVSRLAAYSWPGNVRQLRNVARHLVASSRDLPQAELGPRLEEILAADAGSATASPACEPASPEATPLAQPSAGCESRPAKRSTKIYRQVVDVSEEELLEVLRANRWKLQPTAADLGVSRTALYSLIDSCAKVRRPRHLGREEIEDCRKRCGDNIEAMVDELQVSRKGLRRRMTELGLP